MHNRIETENLLLRKPVFPDWSSMYRNLWSWEESAKYMLWSVTSSEVDAQERMRRSIAYQEKCVTPSLSISSKPGKESDLLE